MIIHNSPLLRAWLKRSQNTAQHIAASEFHLDDEAFARARVQVSAHHPGMSADQVDIRAAFVLLREGHVSRPLSKELGKGVWSKWGADLWTALCRKPVDEIAWRIAVLVLLAIIACALIAKAEPDPANSVPASHALAALHANPPLAIFGGIVIQLQNAGSTLATRGGGLVIFNCTGSGLSCSFSGSTFTMNGSGGGGTGCVPPGTHTNAFLIDSGTGTCPDFGGFAAATHFFVTGLNSSGAFQSAQPAFGDISGSWATSQAPASANSCASHQFTISLASGFNVTCAQPAFSDISGSISTGQIPSGNSCSTHQFAISLGSGLTLSCAQPTLADVAAGVALSGTFDFTGATPTVPTAAANDNSTKAASTAYVDRAIAGVNPAVAVQAATNAILPNSPTYNNGAAGIGATITTLTLNVALVVDGYTPALNDRVLVKNEGSGGGLGAADNGVYKVTQLAGVGLAWILTRALDYDQPSDINNTGAIPVINGTANATTQWVINSQVTTVGTDPLTYTLFSYTPCSTTGGNAGQVFESNGGTSCGTYQDPVVSGAFPSAVTAAWTSATALNTTLTLNLNSAASNTGGYNSVTVWLNQGSTITAGAVTFEGSDTTGFTNSYPLTCAETQAYTATSTYTLVASTNQAFDCDVAATTAIRVRLSTQITGSATVNVSITANAFASVPESVVGQSDNTKLNATVNVGQVNSTTVATAASGVQKVGIVGNAGAAIDAPTGSAPPANAILHAGLGSGATGGDLVGIPVGDTYKAINISTATTTLIVTGVSGRQVRISAQHMIAAGADNVAWIEGTGATCGTGTAGMAGGTTAASGYNFAANGGIAEGSGLGTVLSTVTTGDSVCLVTSAAVQLSGGIEYSIY